ncbi:NAD(P)H-hydrate dehydratase [Oculatella sp. LEGE 06141]|uniref:NAD(P)H-hydrate dehydratase n=1 Tax=Oculatella sp. LEGE 06141 TaxID=1828648 RepID=UPI00187E1660|nr:NAD(P)H-hydrate dehydratase [Oculatella sp. LEGE 06141]MBE9177606.1 NAD(P)H-hydrate dehydratase [Oculatella sp. LEGE 06141]
MVAPETRSERLQQVVVTAQQMGDIESRIFAAGMPVAALMEKVGGQLAQRIQALYPNARTKRIGCLVGPGHNGGDALVVARELHSQGYDVTIYRPFGKLKDLTAQHAQYAERLGIPHCEQVEPLADCDVLVDGLFGFGLTRSLDGTIATIVDQINQWSTPVISIDVPSGLHTDSGAALGTAIRATRTLCLGLWKLAFMQDQALEYTGASELIDFGIPLADIEAVLGASPPLQRITRQTAIAPLSIPRPSSTYKYKQGHLLLIAGSRQYMGAALLTALSARASGVGMLSVAVPESARSVLMAQVPEGLTIGCPEDETGAIARLPQEVDLSKYSAIACGPGLTRNAEPVVQQVLENDAPLVLDADGLNIVAQRGTVATLSKRAAPTVLTPHLGEFKRLFPDFAKQDDRISGLQAAAQQSKAVVLLKGARTAIANSDHVWFNPESTPALARGGSGDVLTGLIGGLLAQAVLAGVSPEAIVQSAAWWHAQAGILAAQERTELGVDAYTLTHYLIPTLQQHAEAIKRL